MKWSLQAARNCWINNSIAKQLITSAFKSGFFVVFVRCKKYFKSENKIYITKIRFNLFLKNY